MNDLPEHGVRQRRNVDQRSKYNQSLGRSIEQRPMMINQRNRIGDFELDTVVGPRGHSKASFINFNRSQITAPLGIPVKRSDDSDC
ncbi:Mobile element protein [Levilactobacillus brevis]|nr:Mobile element protein [Levilactobacillus brevis]